MLLIVTLFLCFLVVLSNAENRFEWPDPRAEEFKCYGCGKILDKETHMALVCMCGGHEGVCLNCYNETRGDWSLLKYKPEDWQQHHLRPTRLLPELQAERREEMAEAIVKRMLHISEPDPLSEVRYGILFMYALLGCVGLLVWMRRV
jgi:hypothetical protein